MPPGASWAKRSKYLKGDDSADPRQAINVVQKFITKDNVLAIIGGELTGTTRVTAPISNGAETVQFTASATGAGLTDNMPLCSEMPFPKPTRFLSWSRPPKRNSTVGSVVIITSYNLGLFGGPDEDLRKGPELRPASRSRIRSAMPKGISTSPPR